MSNQLTQAELIDLAKKAGFRETVWSNILGVNVESLAKFTQLIQQRKGELDNSAINKIAIDNCHTYSTNDVGNWQFTSKGLLHFARAIEKSAPLAASQLVAQALEKAAQICEAVNNHDNPMTANDCADAIRALIDQPVEREKVSCPDGGYCHHECKEPCARRDKLGCVPLTASGLDDNWNPIEQGGDELVEAVEQIDAYFRSGNEIPVERATIRASDWQALRQALANRRGGE